MSNSNQNLHNELKMHESMNQNPNNNQMFANTNFSDLSSQALPKKPCKHCRFKRCREVGMRYYGLNYEPFFANVHSTIYFGIRNANIRTCILSLAGSVESVSF
jgi:hypothetical protein